MAGIALGLALQEAGFHAFDGGKGCLGRLRIGAIFVSGWTRFALFGAWRARLARFGLGGWFAAQAFTAQGFGGIDFAD